MVKTLTDLQLEDIVRIRRNQAWSPPAVVAQQESSLQSYWVNDGSKMLRKNRSHLLKTREELPIDPADVNIPEPVKAPTSNNENSSNNRNTSPPPATPLAGKNTITPQGAPPLSPARQRTTHRST